MRYLLLLALAATSCTERQPVFYCDLSGGTATVEVGQTVNLAVRECSPTRRKKSESFTQAIAHCFIARSMALGGCPEGT